MSYSTRRHFLAGAVALAGAALPAHRSSLAILSCQCPLSQESHRGYNLAIQNRINSARELIVAAGLREITLSGLAALHSRVQSGAWLIWERAATFDSADHSETERNFAQAFHFPMPATQPSEPTSLYVRYKWPLPVMIRRIGSVPALHVSPSSETIATYAGHPCAFLHRVGFGGVIYLGSMLGPQLSTDKAAAAWLTSVLHAIKYSS